MYIMTGPIDVMGAQTRGMRDKNSRLPRAARTDSATLLYTGLVSMSIGATYPAFEFDQSGRSITLAVIPTKLQRLFFQVPEKNPHCAAIQTIASKQL